MGLTIEQKEKLARLKKLMDVKDDVITNPREALKLAFNLNMINHWSDHGGLYVVTLKDKNPVSMRTSMVSEFIVDKILSAKDPLNETAEEKPLKEIPTKETEDNPKREPKKNTSKEEPERENYEELTNKVLKEICYSRGLVGYTSFNKAELVDLLEITDKNNLNK